MLIYLKSLVTYACKKPAILKLWKYLRLTDSPNFFTPSEALPVSPFILTKEGQFNKMSPHLTFVFLKKIDKIGGCGNKTYWVGTQTNS